MQQVKEESSPEIASRVQVPKAVVVIGASTGGPSALAKIFPKFPKDFPVSIVVVQYMRPGFTKLLARQLDGISEVFVDEAETYLPLKPAAAFLAPGHCSVRVERIEDPECPPFTLTAEDVSSSVEKLRRRVDDAMISAAETFGAHTIGVLLTGVGDDGRDGMKAIREFGGKTLAQDESSSIVFDMPRSAINAGVVDEVVPLWNIAERVIEIVGDS
ncbi:MAG: CheB methylesterase domain-containing protein [Armatimonadota bacterium]